jgi:hypothetical protein
LNITFTPSGSNAYAFVNGIEILSIPSNLYYTPSYKGISFVGQPNQLYIDNDTALEMVYRLNVGGGSISPSGDTGMFQRWSQDDKYFRADEQSVVCVNTTIDLKFTMVRPYTAPKDVYKTARTMGNDARINRRYNLTWELPVHSGFEYLVRLHFCDFEPNITQQHEREFLIFIANQTVEEAADVIKWSGGNGVPVYKEYAVSMIGKEGEKKMKVPIALQGNPQDSKTVYVDAILNGVEIFKVSDNNGNLAGFNPDPLPLAHRIVVPPTPPTKSKNNITNTLAVVGGGVSGFVVLSILDFLIFRWRKNVKDSTETRNSSLPSNLCRYFSLAEIKASTICVLLSLAVHFDWTIRQLDVSNAFLHGSLNETMFMHQPKGFVDNNNPHFVCKLYKALYGLKQAPRTWFNRLSSFLLELGFIASLVDSSLFILKNDFVLIFMLIYVDDIIITGSDPVII